MSLNRQARSMFAAFKTLYLRGGGIEGDEEGRGVAPDRKQAIRLYRQAAATTGGTGTVYMPAVGKHGRAMTVPVNSGNSVAGLGEAIRRLALAQ